MTHRFDGFDGFDGFARKSCFRTIFLKKLINIKAYKGIRRISGLPVRGQRTHTNAKTSRRFRR